MGSVQRMATVVIVGLVALSTVLFLYLGDEDNRIKAEEQEQQEIAIERGMQTYLSNCLQCHGPAGEGYTEPGVSGTGRIGAALGGVNTSMNQTGINSQGTPVAGGLEGRATIIHDTIYFGLKNPDGSYRMPPFSDTLGGPLNDEQINELVTLVQHGDWNEVYNHAIEISGGYPTPPPGAAAEVTPTEAAAAPSTDGGEAGATDSGITVAMHDIYFDPTDFTIPADTPTDVHFVNEGAAVHDFTIDALGIHVVLNPGESATETITAPAGENEYYCSVPCHKDAGMVGKLIASAGAAPAADAAAAPAEEESTPSETDAAAADEAAPAAEAVDVSMHDIYFDPTEISISADTPIEFHFVNDGAAVHDFTIDELGIHISLNPGESATETINAPAGEYEYYCSVPGHKEAGMVGTLTVG